jgi:hypothetical protein
VIFILLHIVRSGESLERIADSYHCEVNDIKSNNLHITDFKKLIPGTKLRIPFLTKEIIETLEETESFISDYYPNLNDKKIVKKQEEPEKNITFIAEEKEVVVESKKEEIKVEKTIEKYSPRIPYNSYYSGNVIPNIPSSKIKKI